MAGEWLTEKNIAFVKTNRADGKSKEWLARELNVTPNAMAGLLHRMKLGRGPDNAPPVKLVKDFWTEDAPEWLTQEADDLLRRMWDGGVPTTPIRVFWNLSEDQLRRRRLRMGLTPRSPGASTARRFQMLGMMPRLNEKKPVAVRAEPKEQAPRPLGHAGGKPTHINVGAINWGAVNRVELQHEPGLCRWPLSCTSPAAKNWCDQHAGLLGRAK